MNSDYVWVIGYTGSVKNYKKFIRCAKNNAAFYAENYRNEGFDTVVFNDYEMNDMVNEGKFKKRVCD